MPLCEPRPVNPTETEWIVESRVDDFTLQKFGISFAHQINSFVQNFGDMTQTFP